MLGLIWIQDQSDSVPERMFQKVDFEKISRRNISMQNFPVGRVNDYKYM